MEIEKLTSYSNVFWMVPKDGMKYKKKIFLTV